MTETMTDYEKICDFQNLYKAHTVARKGKRHKGEVIRFELNLAHNLTTMREQLLNKTYRMKGYYHFIIHEPKKRDIFAAYYSDRLLLHCISDEVLVPLLERRLIYDNAACQVGKGTHFAIDRLNKFLREHYRQHGTEGYVLKCDISKYFASIDHEVLKKQISKVLHDKDVRDLLFTYIDRHHTEGRPGVGIPLGNQCSQWFALYYLDRVDRLIKEKLQVKHYIRYMDDLVLVHPDKKFLSRALEQIRAVVEDELKLDLNAKTQITPLSRGIEFLGWRFFLTDTGKVIRKMKPQSKLRYKRRLRKLQKDYEAGVIEFFDVQQCLAAYDGHLTYGHTYKLKEKVMSEFVLQRPSPMALRAIADDSSKEVNDSELSSSFVCADRDFDHPSLSKSLSAHISSENSCPNNLTPISTKKRELL